MAAMKSVGRSAMVAFAPTAPDIVGMGTMSGAIDASFSASASLDIFKIDFSTPDTDLQLLTSFSSTEKFNRLSWGTAGSAGGEAHPYGLLAGGLSDGNVCIWNPAPLIRSQSFLSCLSSLCMCMCLRSDLANDITNSFTTINIGSSLCWRSGNLSFCNFLSSCFLYRKENVEVSLLSKMQKHVGRVSHNPLFCVH
mgnify:CR=1 FL=1